MTKIHVVGLGPGDMTGLPMGTYRRLKSGLPVFLRTRIHPVVDELVREGLSITTFDHLYDTGERFDEIYRQMAEQLLDHASQHGDLIYAVPGHPLMAEQSVQYLLELAEAQRIEIDIQSGQSFLDAVCTVLRIDPVDGLLLLDGMALSQDSLQPSMPTLVVQVGNRQVASDAKLTLMDVYADTHLVTVVRAAGVAGLERVEQVCLYELDHLDWIDQMTTVYVPPAVDPETKGKDPWFPVDLVRRLRQPDGCPWDRKQTHATLRPYVIEEAYEVAAAIRQDDPDALADELGDLLLQVLLHAQIAEENGDFTVRDVYAALSDKLIRRHPHVFGDIHVISDEDAQAAWSAAKAAERPADRASESLLGEVKWARPPHLVAAELQNRAAQIGFDWHHVKAVVCKLKEEVDELDHALSAETGAAQCEELGDVLFTVSNVCRWLHLDMEQVLQQANEKFAARFREMERIVQAEGNKLEEMSIEKQENAWIRAKSARKYANMSENMQEFEL